MSTAFSLGCPGGPLCATVDRGRRTKPTRLGGLYGMMSRNVPRERSTRASTAHGGFLAAIAGAWGAPSWRSCLTAGVARAQTIAPRRPGPVRSSGGEPSRDLCGPRHPERRQRRDVYVQGQRHRPLDHAGDGTGRRGAPRSPLGDTGLLWSPVMEGGDRVRDVQQLTSTAASWTGTRAQSPAWRCSSGAASASRCGTTGAWPRPSAIIYAHTENDF